MRLGLDSDPTLDSALLFAIALLIAPGLSCSRPSASASWQRAPNPAAVRLINVSVHAVFGLGLYLGAIAWLWALHS